MEGRNGSFKSTFRPKLSAKVHLFDSSHPRRRLDPMRLEVHGEEKGAVALQRPVSVSIRRYRWSCIHSGMQFRQATFCIHEILLLESQKEVRSANYVFFPRKLCGGIQDLSQALPNQCYPGNIDSVYDVRLVHTYTHLEAIS